ncbi:hypothetical protein HYH03_014322 [Edaphochlamys debaryana]|uniref:Nucleosome assembly protein n=1 Tax=Edaphochlamys debaryana TaxID=47281 RepID=A0A836BS38_9CHLO|nr:hypothetical protein HYH03_014322 [Edaphochlamys debaryana]|eukprot:KAG2487076.1 hypothetical protein HYH03_014322 [Edaphochlamys debaryana]
MAAKQEKRVLAAIEEIEVQVETAHTEHQQRLEEALVDYLAERGPLVERRYELVTGRSEPTPEELQGFKPQGAAAAAEGAGGAAGGKAGGGKGGKGVPFFWLNALCSQETLAPLITPRDRCALEYLQDVRYLRGPMGMQVEFLFGPNPYFNNQVLRKGIFVRRAPASRPGGPPGDIEEIREEATVIDWKPGRSLLVRAAEPAAARKGAAKKAAGGGGGGKKAQGKGAKEPAPVPRAKRHHGKHGAPPPDLPDPEEEEAEEEAGAEEEEEEEAEAGQEEVAAGGGGGRRRPCPSFFRFFLPVETGSMAKRKEIDPTRDPDDDDEEEEEEEHEGGEEQLPSGAAARAAALRERQTRDGQVLDVLIKHVVPRAVHLYLAAGGKGPGSHPEGHEEEEGFQLVSGTPAGDMASLALTAQRALYALVGLQKQLDALSLALKEREWASAVQLRAQAAKLGEQRRTLLVGPAGAPSGLSVPAFWLRALKATPVGGSLVQHRDERCLSYLADVRMVWDERRMPSPEEPLRLATLELEFLPNPYFSNPLLKKHFTFAAPGGSLNKLGVKESHSEPIDWLPDRDLTLRRPPGEGGGAPRPVPSFFQFFSNATGALCRAFHVPGGQSRAAQEAALDAQEELIAELVNHLLPMAGRLAAQCAVDVRDLGDEQSDDEADESDEEEDEEGEEEDGEEAAARRAARRAAAAAGRRRGADGSSGGLLRRLFAGGTASYVMGAFVVIMFLAQILVFMDTLEFVRSKYRWV